jgi:hypothetical protein
LAFAPAFFGDFDLVACVLARDVPLAFGFALPSPLIRSFSWRTSLTLPRRYLRPRPE